VEYGPEKPDEGLLCALCPEAVSGIQKILKQDPTQLIQLRLPVGAVTDFLHHVPLKQLIRTAVTGIPGDHFVFDMKK